MMDRCYFGWQHRQIVLLKKRDFQKKAHTIKRQRTVSLQPVSGVVHLAQELKKEQHKTGLEASDNQKHNTIKGPVCWM